MKKTFHVIFKNNESDFMSKGINIISDDMLSAISHFIQYHPGTQFIALYDLDLLAEMKGNRKEDIKNIIVKNSVDKF